MSLRMRCVYRLPRCVEREERREVAIGSVDEALEGKSKKDEGEINWAEFECPK